ncbi:hypothetical protein K491DRAFT_598869, partial [Lophiostoma macrostomum CBS 122681]
QRLRPLQRKFLIQWILDEEARGHPPTHTRTHQVASRILLMNSLTLDAVASLRRSLAIGAVLTMDAVAGYEHYPNPGCGR